MKTIIYFQWLFTLLFVSGCAKQNPDPLLYFYELQVPRDFDLKSEPYAEISIVEHGLASIPLDMVKFDGDTYIFSDSNLIHRGAPCYLVLELRHSPSRIFKISAPGDDEILPTEWSDWIEPAWQQKGSSVAMHLLKRGETNARGSSPVESGFKLRGRFERWVPN